MIGVGRFIGIGVNRFRAGGGFSAEYQTVYDSFTTKPSDEVAASQNAMVEDWVSSGAWATRDVWYVTAGHTNDNGESLTNWKKPGTNDATIVGSVTFVAFEGFTSAGGYINTNYNPNTEGVHFTQNSASFGIKTIGAVKVNSAHGIYDSSVPALMIGNANGVDTGRINANLPIAGTTEISGFNGVNRSASDTTQGREGIRNEEYTQNSTGVPNANLYLLAYNDVSSGVGTFIGTGTMQMAYAGGSLTWSQYLQIVASMEVYLDGDNVFDNGKALFTMDDYMANSYDKAFPLFQTKGVTGTMYMPTDFLINSTYWDNLKTMVTAGWSYSNHSKTHTLFTSLTDEEAEAEMVDSNAAFVSNGMAAPGDFCFPGDVYDPSEWTIMQSYFTSYRAYDLNNVFPVYKETGKYLMNSIAIDNTHYDEANIKAFMDYSKIRKSALIMTSHDVLNDTGVGGGIDISNLETLIDYAQSIGLDIINIDSLVSLMD